MISKQRRAEHATLGPLMEKLARLNQENMPERRLPETGPELGALALLWGSAGRDTPVKLKVTRGEFELFARGSTYRGPELSGLLVRALASEIHELEAKAAALLVHRWIESDPFHGVCGPIRTRIVKLDAYAWSFVVSYDFEGERRRTSSGTRTNEANARKAAAGTAESWSRAHAEAMASGDVWPPSDLALATRLCEPGSASVVTVADVVAICTAKGVILGEFERAHGRTRMCNYVMRHGLKMHENAVGSRK